MTDTEKILEKLETLNQKMDDGFKNLSDRLEVMEIKQKMTHKKLNELSLDVKVMERDIRQDLARLNDETETLIAVMEAKGILPKVIND